METQKPPNSQSILRKKNGAEESTFLNSDYTTKHQGSPNSMDMNLNKLWEIVKEGQGSLAYFSPWSYKEVDMISN